MLLPGTGGEVAEAAVSVARLKLVLREGQASPDGRRSSRVPVHVWASGAFPALAARPRLAAAAAACRRFSGVSSLCSLSPSIRDSKSTQALKVQCHID